MAASVNSNPVDSAEIVKHICQLVSALGFIDSAFIGDSQPDRLC